MPDTHFTFSARAPAALTCFTARTEGRQYNSTRDSYPANDGGGEADDAG